MLQYALDGVSTLQNYKNSLNFHLSFTYFFPKNIRE